MVGRNSGIGNVNFDYSGPPVAVSNGMALDLVGQFGIQNAWYAFLKLRGLSTFKDDAEKDQACKCFRNRIRELRRSTDNLKEKSDELNALLSEEFNSTDLISNDSASNPGTIEGEAKNAKSSTNNKTHKTRQNGDDTTESADDKDDSEADDLGKLVIDEDASGERSAASPTKFQTPISETINSVVSQLKTSASNSASNSSKKTSGESTAPPTTTAANSAPTNLVASTSQADNSTAIGKTSKLAKNNSANRNSNSDAASAESDRRHCEIFDDVVSSVMAKIRSNEPLGSEIFGRSSSISSQITTTTHTTAAATKGRKTKNVFVKQSAAGQSSPLMTNAAPLSQLASIAASSGNTLVDSSTGAIVTFPTSSEQITPQISNPIVPDQVTILSNFTEIIRSSTSSHQTATSQLTPVTKVITQSNHSDISAIPQQLQQQHFQQQQQIAQLPVGSTIQFPGFSLPLTATTTGGIPIGISPQGTITLPNNITVQSLLQSLQQPAKKQQLVQLAQFQLAQPSQSSQPIQLQIQPGIQQASVQQILQAQKSSQQILPDSSQDVGSSASSFSAGQPTSYTCSNAAPSSSDNSTKTTKKRQYVRRKGIASNAVENEAEVKSPPATVAKEEKAAAVIKPTVSANEPTAKSATTSSGTSTTNENAAKSIPKKAANSKNVTIEAPSDKKDSVSGNATDKAEDKQKTSSPKRSYTKKSISKVEVATLPKTSTPKSSNAKESTSKKAAIKQESISTESKPANASAKSSEEDLSKITDLESQLAKCQRQLNAEKNKTTSQKKRIDKLQADLEKNADAIQLVQIDLACQKTDNNNLMAENIALKAELQKLKSKESKLTNKTNVSTTSTSKQSASKKGKDQPSASKDMKKTQKAGTKRQNKEEEEPAESVSFDEVPEFGRRQSKRICVARKNFLYGAF